MSLSKMSLQGNIYQPVVNVIKWKKKKVVNPSVKTD